MTAQRCHPRHIVHPSNLTLQECLAISDVVISAVPSPTYKVKTEWLKDGCICVNVASDKNFEKDVRDKVNQIETHGQVTHSSAGRLGVNLHPCGWKSDYIHVVAESVG
jgi:methylenetetrahydrofolate dehydrogenase (NAD+)